MSVHTQRYMPCPRCNGTGHDPKAKPNTSTDRCPCCHGAEVITYEAADTWLDEHPEDESTTNSLFDEQYL